MSVIVPMPENQSNQQHTWGKIELDRLSEFEIGLHENIVPLLQQMDLAEGKVDPLILPLPSFCVTRRVEPDNLRVYALLTPEKHATRLTTQTGLARCILMRELDGPVYAEKHHFRRTRYGAIDANDVSPFKDQDQKIMVDAFKRVLRHYTF